MSKVEVKKSKLHGKGVFATQDIKKNEFIMYFRGKRIYSEPGDPLYGMNWLQVGTNHFVVPKRGAAGRYLNHSCNPNAGIRGSVTIIAMKKIKKGEEIKIDYSMSETEPGWYLKCNCKEKNCRKVAKTFQELPSKIKGKYRGYVPTYVRKNFF